MARAANFDRIAHAYIWFEYAALGPLLQRTRTEFLPLLDRCRDALVLGDGDGRFTAAFMERNRSIAVAAVDSSPPMLALLRARVARLDRRNRPDGEAINQAGTAALRRLQAFCSDATQFMKEPQPTRSFDLIVTHFFLDCLGQSEVDDLVRRAAARLTPGGLWLVSEFCVPDGRLRLVGRLSIRLLYAAFRVLTGLRASSLPDHERALRAVGLRRICYRRRLFGLLTSELWQAGQCARQREFGYAHHNPMTADASHRTQPSLLGTSPLRKEGVAKVMGTAQYVDDLVLGRMIHGATVRSTVARGRILSIRFEEKDATGRAMDWSEFTVVTAADIPGENTIIHLTRDHPCLAAGFVNHPEEPILLLAHADKARLPAAVAAVTIRYEESPGVFTIEQSEDAAARAADGDESGVIWQGHGHGGGPNTFKTYTMRKDGIDTPAEIWKKAAFIVEGEYRTGAQEQLYIENNGVIAECRMEDGRLAEVTVQGSMQCPFYLVHALEQVFDLPPDRCRVIQTETGGAFGGKEDFPSVIGSHAALLAMKSGRPVKMVYDRAEDMVATTKRHPSRTRHRTAVAKDGRLLAGEIDFAIDGGAYATLSPVVLSRGVIHASGPYHWPHLTIRGKAMATNVAPHGAFRGFGAPQSVFAMERHMDRMARVVGITPEEMRRRNFLEDGGCTATGQHLKEPVDMQGLLTQALAASDYHRKRDEFARNNVNSPIKRGMGFATFFHGSGFTGSGERRLNSLVEIELADDGRPVILVSSTEFGQGTNTILCQVAAEALGIAYDDVRIAQPDTYRVPNSGPTVASRTAMIVGKLVERAAAQMLERLAEHVVNGDFCAGARRYLAQVGPLKVGVRYEAPPDIFWDDEQYRGDAYPAYAWAVYVAEVAVDTRTYAASVTAFHAVQEVGKVLHGKLAAGQIEGGVAQGIGYALYEKCVYQDGRMMNGQMTNYIMPTSADLPPIHVHFAEVPSAHGPGGAKGIGELPMDGPAPAILNAIEDALGLSFNQIPLLPEDIFARMCGEGGELDPTIIEPEVAAAAIPEVRA